MKKIVDFYLKTIVPSPQFNSPEPVDDMDLLYPGFLEVFRKCVAQYKKVYPDQDITFSETYRSNILQEQYYNSGASKIKKDGMHHYGIAGDSIFIIKGKRTYKGDISLLRKIYEENGLTILGMWDALHVQFIPVADQQKLRDLANQPAGKSLAGKLPESTTFKAEGDGATATISVKFFKGNTADHLHVTLVRYLDGSQETEPINYIGGSVSFQNVAYRDLIRIDGRCVGTARVTISGVTLDHNPAPSYSGNIWDSFIVQ